MLKIIILEDDKLFAKNLARTLQENNCEVAGIASSVEEAKKLFETCQPNFAFIDIELPGESDNGVAFAEYINQKCRIPFIYISAHFGSQNPYFKRATATMPANYIPKGSFLPAHLWHFVETAMTNYSKAGGLYISEDEAQAFIRNQFFVRRKGQWEKINSSDILYLKVSKPYCEIKTVEGKTFLVRKALEFIIDQLNISHLLRIHQSHAVNLTYVVKYDAANSVMILSNQQKFDVGKTYKTLLKGKVLMIE
ncbi:MAG: LytTR family transcriptional regulator DNA-binding domain-containing protein [Lacibacter sp.]